MKGKSDWEARARELAYTCSSDEGLAEAALQLGREMAEEARNAEQNSAWLVSARLELQRKAADERAEEIARGTEAFDARLVAYNDYWKGYKDALKNRAAIARSTITKPKEPEYAAGIDLARGKDATVVTVRFTPQAEEAIRADEAEKIAQRLRDDGLGPVWIERITGAKPKTREQAIEAALRQLVDDFPPGIPLTARAREALEWKP